MSLGAATINTKLVKVFSNEIGDTKEKTAWAIVFTTAWYEMLATCG